jgi:hypothetical protein
MKTAIALIIIFGTVTAATARAQVEPEATSPSKVTVSGTLTYSARYSQIFEYYGGVSGQMANLFGNFSYTSTNERHPTSITLGAGDSWAISGIGYSSGPYEDLNVSQSINGQRLLLLLHDQLSYQSGVGISQPNPTSQTSAAEPILTLNTAVLNNDAGAQLSDKLSGSTTLSAGMDFDQLDYPNGNGFSSNAFGASSTNEFGANLELSHRAEGRNTFFARDAFSDFTYPGSKVDIAIHSDMATAGWSRIWTHRISTSVSAGPQWVTFQTGPPLPSIPSSTGYAVNASVSDTLRFGSATVAFSHGINGGGGYFYGAEQSNVSGTFTRQFGRHVGSEFTVNLVGGYTRTGTLNGVSSIQGGLQGNFDSKYGYAQATRQLGRHFSAYASYSATDQSSTSTAAASGLLNGVWQTISFGFGFTPPPIHLRQ